MTKTYEELEAIDKAEDERDRARVLHMLGLLTPDTTGLDILILHSKVCDETWKERSATRPMTEPLDVLKTMSAKQLAALRARVIG